MVEFPGATGFRACDDGPERFTFVNDVDRFGVLESANEIACD